MWWIIIVLMLWQTLVHLVHVHLLVVNMTIVFTASWLLWVISVSPLILKIVILLTITINIWLELFFIIQCELGLFWAFMEYHWGCATQLLWWYTMLLHLAIFLRIIVSFTSAYIVSVSILVSNFIFESIHSLSTIKLDLMWLHRLSRLIIQLESGFCCRWWHHH